MSISNSEIADKLESFASLLDLAEASHYTSRAYRRAAEMIRETKAPMADLVRQGRARELRGIGPGIEQRLRELVETGSLHELEELEERIAPELVGLGRLLGLGPKRMSEIGRALDVRTVEGFRQAVAAGLLSGVPGVGPKTEAKIVAGLRQERPRRPRRGMLLNRAHALVEAISEPLGGEPAGDPRRWRDASFDFAVVCAAMEAGEVMERFERLPLIVALVEREERRAIGVTVEGVPVRLVVASPERFGTELVRATGSPEYVAALEPLPDAPDEEGVYRALGIPYCPPELRERPFRGEPPPLVELADIRGDLHVHSNWSDGKATILEMAEAARDRGYEYLAICDHTRNVRVVPGLDADDLRRQAEEIAAVNEQVAPFRVLRGTECDILPEGSLDLPDDVLAELDWVQASVHAGQRAPRGGDHEADDRGDEASGGAVALPSEGADHQSPPGERARSGAGVRGRSGDRDGARGERPAGPARSPRRARAGGNRGRGADHRVDGCALGARPEQHATRRRHSAPRLGPARKRREHPTPVRNPRLSPNDSRGLTPSSVATQRGLTPSK